MRNERTDTQLVQRLVTALGEQLTCVIVYGPAAHDDSYRLAPDQHLLIVLRDLGPATLRALAEPIRWWRAHGEAWPRLFTPQQLRDAADVFPLEMLDISEHRRVVYGDDPMTGIPVDREQLRLQCERELREKLMRLREGYIESQSTGHLRELLAASFPAFVRVFRGCLYLSSTPVARHDHDVVAELCTLLDLSPHAFEEIERIARGERGDAEQAFAAYYDALEAAVYRIDRLIIRKERTS